ncbi:hypothetical protein ACNELP_004853, partial [Escherichia coli]
MRSYRYNDTVKKNITLIMFTLSLLTGNPAIAYETDKVYKITVL